MRDFVDDKSQTRLLEIECNFDDDYLIGHAHRMGLVGEQTSAALTARLLPTIRADIVHERDSLRDLDLPNSSRMREDAQIDENAAAIARFLQVDADVARRLAETPHLFVD